MQSIFKLRFRVKKRSVKRGIGGLLIMLALALVLSVNQVPVKAVAPKTPPMTTPWTAAAIAAIANPLPEYPRPQMTRPNWQSLNGEWQWEATAAGSAVPVGRTLASRINVPYPVESALSGVMTNDNRMWYRRTFTIPAGWSGQRVLLNFGAVDWQTTVYVNGVSVGSHSGGYDAFTFDITPRLNGGTNELIVNVYDPTDADGVNQPMGKQRNTPDLGIMYTGASGIWQTVWLEPVPTAGNVSRLDMTPNIDNGTLNVVVQGTAGQTATVTAYFPGTTTVVGSASGSTGANITVPVPNPHLWTPNDPYLYDIKVTLSGGDVVTGYFGMRKVSLGTVNGILRPLLNNQFVFHVGTLDQGYWPDGIYTAPTDAALRADLENQKMLGYNMVRKHIKVEPQRWFYWADKLGIMVWQDMPTMPNSPNASQQAVHTAEFHEIVDEHRSSPAIVMWVDHNEGWGQYNQAGLATTVKGWDPTRLVNNMSGVNCCGAVDGGNGDVVDWHCYLGPCSPLPSASRAAVWGEGGGLGLKVAGHEWNAAASHSYIMETSPANLVSHYVSIMTEAQGLVNNPGLSASVYTEPVDVEAEVNGWYTYDRLLKVTTADISAIRTVNIGLANAVNTTYSNVVATSESAPQSWRYTTAAPAADWNSTGFNDSGWAVGNGGFGTAGTPGGVIGTTWSTTDIWLRRSFNPGALTAIQRSGLAFRLHHDEDAELYINGVLAASVTGYTGNYVFTPMNTAGQNAVVANGNNILAIHVHQTTGGQYIDAGVAIKTSTTPTVALVSTSETAGQSWKYTTAAPASNWNTTGFGDSAWSTGNGGFGTAGTPGAVIGTTWSTADIWLRKTFNPGNITTAQKNSLTFRLHHDEDAELYINGVLAAQVTGYTSNYDYVSVSAAAEGAVVANANNVLAIHVHQTTGGQYIDAGLYIEGTAALIPPGNNLALYKPTSAGGMCANTEGPDKAVNGSVSAGNMDKWCDGSATKWMQVDLGANYSINQFVIRHAGAGGESTAWNTSAFTIQVSTDNVNWSTPVTVTGNTASITTHNIAATTGRYVKLNISNAGGDGTARIYEFEVYGSGGIAPTNTPVPPTNTPIVPTNTPVGPTPTRTNTPVPTNTPTPLPVNNLALNKPATSSGNCTSNEGPDKAVNGSVSGGNADKWCGNTTTKWMQVDLGANYNVNQFIVRHAGAGGESASWNTNAFNIQLSTDNVNWSTVVNISGNTANITTHNITAATGRYARLNVTNGGGDGVARIYEFEVYGSGPIAPTNTPPAVPTNTPSGVAAWAPNVAYSVGTVVSYGGLNYKCIQAHRSQVGWEPPNTPSLWQQI